MSFLRPVFHFVSPLVVAAATLSAGCSPPYKAVACAQDSDCPSMDQIEHLMFDDAGVSYEIENGVAVETGINVPGYPGTMTQANPAGTPIKAQCCAGACVIFSSGCDSGFRYIASHSGGGYDVNACVDKGLMCTTPDLAMPAQQTDM